MKEMSFERFAYMGSKPFYDNEKSSWGGSGGELIENLNYFSRKKMAEKC